MHPPGAPPALIPGATSLHRHGVRWLLHRSLQRSLPRSWRPCYGPYQSHLVLQLSTPAYARSSIKLRGGSGSLISEKTTPTMDRMTEEFGDAVLDRPFTAQAKTPVHNHQGISRSLRPYRKHRAILGGLICTNTSRTSVKYPYNHPLTPIKCKTF
jgi:hypothetical protein